MRAPRSSPVANALSSAAISPGYYVAPTIFTGNNKMRVFQEEIFGPVVR